MSLRHALLASTMTAALLGGCHSDPYCLNCDNTGLQLDLAGVDQLPGPDLAGVDLIVPPDLTGFGCIPSNGGVEICDGLDNDCNGAVDDVSAAKLAADPNNCGVCGHACNFTAQKQFGVCDDSTGTPTCKPGDCLPGFVDTDGNPANGCDYECTPTGTEICDGIDNDCDKTIDNGFDKMNDPLNCGGCGVVCPAIAGNSVGSCSGGVCQPPICNPGYKNLNGNPNDGCEYQCPVFPTVPETCNGVDDDCDGVKDNAPTDVGQACDNFCGTVNACVAGGNCSPYTISANHGGTCYGQCMEGHVICAGGVKACQATPPLPAIEACDGIDNNCDGRIDEGFNKQTDPLNCNTCGNKCQATTNQASVQAYKCTAGTCGIAACKPGFANLNGSLADGCEYTCPVNPPTTESCNGKDDDCDGLIDEIAGAPGNIGSVITAPSNFCFQGSICSGAQPVCCGTPGWLCDYKSVNAGVEIQENAGAGLACKRASDGVARTGGTLVFTEAKCDNIDGDCRNGADDSFAQKGKACSVGVGACAGTSTFVCGGSSNVGACAGSNNTMVCCPTANDTTKRAAEECDGIDNNCDGQIDERFETPTNPTFPGYTDRFVQVSASPALWVYAYEASRIDAKSSPLTAGVNSAARSCSKPGVLPWASVTRAQAEAACEAILLQDPTKHARLCTAAEWQKACEGPTGAQAHVFAYSTTGPNATYVANVCNDASSGSGSTVWATGHDNGPSTKCYADWLPATNPGGELFDLTANLAEWTSTVVSVSTGDMAAINYYKVRGGAFTTSTSGTPLDSPGSTCEFDFDIFPDTYSNKDVGFRCCSDFQP